MRYSTLSEGKPAYCPECLWRTHLVSTGKFWFYQCCLKNFNSISWAHKPEAPPLFLLQGDYSSAHTPQSAEQECGACGTLAPERLRQKDRGFKIMLLHTY